MIAFEVSLNGNRVCVAGAEDMAILTAMVMAVGKLGEKTIRTGTGADETSHDISCTVGGRTGRPNREKDVVACWTPDIPLQIGDVIQIKVLETDKVDRAKSRSNAARRRSASK